MLLKLLTAAALGLMAPVAQAQTVPAAEPPVKAVPQSGRQAKPLPVDNDGLVTSPPEASPAGRAHGRQHADRAARRTHGSGGHGPGGHGSGGHGSGGHGPGGHGPGGHGPRR